MISDVKCMTGITLTPRHACGNHASEKNEEGGRSQWRTNVEKEDWGARLY